MAFLVQKRAHSWTKVLPGYRFPGLFSLLTPGNPAWHFKDMRKSARQKNMFVYCTTVVLDQKELFSLNRHAQERVPDFLLI